MTDVVPPPLIRRPDEGERIDAAGIPHLFRLTGADTGGRFAFEEFTLAAGMLGARPHVHEAHDEYFYVLDGVLTVHDGRDEVELGPGGLAAALRGTAHGFRNASAAEVRGLVLYTPAGYEQYFRDIHAAEIEGNVITVELLADLRSRYDSRTL